MPEMLNDDVRDVVDHVSSMSSDWDFDINPDNATEAVEDSAYALGIALDQMQVQEAVDALVNGPDRNAGVIHQAVAEHRAAQQ